MSDRRTPRAPSGLAAAGRRLWRTVVGRYDLRPDEAALLAAAARTADELAVLEAALEDSPPVVVGSTGQPRPNGLFGEVRAHREILRRLLADLDVPEDEDQAETDGMPEQWARRGA